MSVSDVSKEPVVDWGIRLFFNGLAAGLALAGTGTIIVEKLTSGRIETPQFWLAPLAFCFFLYSANQIIQKLKKVALP
jgi:hypothetical protein